MNEIDYRIGNDFSVDQMIELYRASTLGERRPIDDRPAMTDMHRHANLIVTAWDGETMVGISRSLTDFSFVGYLSDLAVHLDYQRMGIGIELIRRTREQMAPRAHLILLAAPAAVEYYPKIGFSKHHSAWVLRGDDPFPRA